MSRRLESWELRRQNVPGTIYLLHLLEPYVPYPGAPAGSCAQHYTGFAEGGARGLAHRIAQHGTREGSPLLLAARQAGIGWELARTWAGTRTRERQLKNMGSARRYCPMCGITPRRAQVLAELPYNRDGSLSRLWTTDWQKDLAGVMTAAQLEEHSELRDGAWRGRVPGAERLAITPEDDLWYVPAGEEFALAAGGAA